MAFNRTNLHGLDDIAAEGVEAFQTLHDLFVDLRKDILICEKYTQRINITFFSRVYMKTDYKLHVQESDICAYHCRS